MKKIVPLMLAAVSGEASRLGVSIAERGVEEVGDHIEFFAPQLDVVVQRRIEAVNEVSEPKNMKEYRPDPNLIEVSPSRWTTLSFLSCFVVLTISACTVHFHSAPARR